MKGWNNYGYSPINIKRSMRYGNNYWEVYSPKLNRNVRLFSDLEYDNWVYIETNPNVVLFCEQPLKIKVLHEGKIKESIFDMWVLYNNNVEEFQEVKYISELNGSSKKSERSIKQIELQKKWCRDNDYNYVIKTDAEIRKNLTHLNNLKYIIGQVRNSNDIQKEDFNLILKHLSIYKSMSVQKMVSITNFNAGYILKIVSLLIYKGYCNILNPYINLSLETEVYLANVE